MNQQTCDLQRMAEGKNLEQFLTLTTCTLGKRDRERVSMVLLPGEAGVKTSKLLDLTSTPPPFVEIDMLCRCRHPHLAHGQDLTVQDDKTLSIQMDLAPCNLNDLLEEARFRIHNRLLTACQVVGAVHALHTQIGAVHLDIKPANILMYAKHKVRLSDFGHTVYLGTHTTEMQVEGSRGTPYFRPPEMDSTNPTVSRACDIWSLGLTLLCLLARRRFPIPIVDRSSSSPRRNALHPIEDNGQEAITARTRYSITVFVEDPSRRYARILRLLDRCPNAELAAQMLGKMLAPEPKDRLTIQQVADHPFWTSFDARTGVRVPLDKVEFRNLQDPNVYIPSLIRNSLELLGKTVIEEYPKLRATVVFRCLDLIVRSVQYRAIPDELTLAARYQAALPIALGLDQAVSSPEDTDWKQVGQLIVDLQGLLATPMLCESMPFTLSLRALFGTLMTPERFLAMKESEYLEMFRSSGTCVAKHEDLLPA